MGGWERMLEMGHGELRQVAGRLPRRQHDAYLGAVEGPWVCHPWRRRMGVRGQRRRWSRRLSGQQVSVVDADGMGVVSR